jgi:hypothetical protein
MARDSSLAARRRDWLEPARRAGDAVVLGSARRGLASTNARGESGGTGARRLTGEFWELPALGSRPYADSLISPAIPFAVTDRLTAGALCACRPRVPRQHHGVMAAHRESGCVFCGRAVSRIRAHDRNVAHDVDCAACGKYRISVAEEDRVAAVGPAIATLAPAIRRVNARGFRLSIPEQMLIPLEHE